MDNELMEVRERLIRIETLLETDVKSLEARIKRLEENNIWLTRAVIAEVIGIIAAFIVNKI